MSVSTNGGPAPQRHRLALNDVTKTYGSTRALKGVDLTLEAGRLQALIGPNGAGKSTIVKCLAGAITPDSGTIIAGPEEHRGFASPVQAKAAGISVVHQDPESFEDLTVAQNIVIAKLPRRGRGFWAIRDRSAANERAAEVLQMVGLDIDPREHMRRLSLADRTLVAICRAIVEDVRFLILDEPTAALGREDARRVYDVCHAVREQGAGVLVVTHRLHEVLSHATRVTALRDGLVHADQPTQSMSVEQIARLVATTGGAGVDEDRSAMREDVVVSASGLSGNGFTGPVDIELRAGEAAAVAGLPGSGANDFVRRLCGVEAGAGDVEVTTHGSHHKVGFVGESRRAEGIFPDMSVLDNMVIAGIRGPSLLPIRRRALEARAREIAEEFGIVAPSLDVPISTLSGGNQQKALIGRWVVADAAVLGLEEPTNGLDIGAREDIYRAVRELLRAGKAIIARCTDEEEAVLIGDRMLVFTEGRLAATLPAGASASTVLELSTPRVAQRRESEPQGV